MNLTTFCYFVGLSLMLLYVSLGALMGFVDFFFWGALTIGTALGMFLSEKFGDRDEWVGLWDHGLPYRNSYGLFSPSYVTTI